MTDRVSVAQSSPSTSFWLEGDVVETDSDYGTNGRWRVRLYLRARNDGNTSSNYGGDGDQVGYINGTERIRHSGDPFLPSGVGAGVTRWRDGPADVWITANTNGYWSGTSTSLPVSMRLVYGNVNWTGNGTIPLPRILRTPGAPGVPTTSEATGSSIRLTTTAPSADGSGAVDNYQFQVSTTSNHASPLQSPQTGSTSRTLVATGLPAGVTLYARARAHNSAGWGAWSGNRSFSLGTAPTTAPGVAVVSSARGTSADVALSPPSGLGGLPLGGYDLTREYLTPEPTPTPSVVTTRHPAAGALSVNIPGLVPGASYRWRARAYNSVGDSSVYSAWQTVQQNKPNTTPGSYFDGSTTDSPDVTYTWENAVNNSRSTAFGLIPTGWGIIGSPTGSAALVRDTQSGMSALVTILRDMTAPFEAGLNTTTYLAAVLEGLEYTAGIAFLTNRPQPMALEMIWLNSSNVELSRIVSEPVTSNGDKRTISMVGTAPANATKLRVAVIDVSGPGWSPWITGEQFWLDEMIVTLGDIPIPYFSGSTPDGDGFTYSWLGTPHLSVSRRAGSPVFVNPLIDPDCAATPPPPRPPSIPTDCIDDIVEWDRYWYGIPATEIPVWTSMLPTIRVRTQFSAERQVRIRVYPDPFGRGIGSLTLDDFCSEIIVSYMPYDTELTLDALTQRAWAQVAGGASISASHLLYGSDGTPATYPELTCGMQHFITVDVPVGSIVGNVTIDVDLQGKF